jgi:deoxycytidine triphosphate deaminase
MSIKPDWWIRERAHEGMIDPFVEHLERAGVISYGLSSFGYDLRAAPEWRIFVNAFNTVVDPKAFDSTSLVEWQGSTCIIPPNSFVLTRSVEYLRIPEDTMVVALGKSSYARCFSADTRVALVDGTTPTLHDMAERPGTPFVGYSLGPHGRTVATRLAAPRFVGRDTLVEVVLDDGATVHATPDHDFMLRDGSWSPADALRPGMALMPLRRTSAPRRTASPPWAPAPPRPPVAAAAGASLAGAGPGLEGGARWGRRRVAAASDPERSPAEGGRRVAGVRPLRGEHDVYCLSVPATGNFALAAGVVVSNCGIVANVTPLEPGWEGHVTLELSNTTPLPAKVYAHEGIVQLLFFQGDRPEVTYRDRKGKYQGQRGVTLPRL